MICLIEVVISFSSSPSMAIRRIFSSFTKNGLYDIVSPVEGKSNSGNLDGFKEKFSLGDKFDGEDVEALIVDGILTVSIPYKESVKPRKVKVKVG